MINYEKPVVYTCVTNGYSDISSPPSALVGSFEFLLLSPEYVECEGWKSIKMNAPTIYSSRRVAKLPKIQPWNFFQAEVSVWLDANMKINVKEFIETYESFIKSDASFGLCAHNKRTTLDEEFIDVTKRLKDDPELIKRQQIFYEKTIETRKIRLFHGGLLMRKHSDPEITQLMSCWQSHIDQHSVRDQLSLSFLLDQQKPKNLKIFNMPVNKIVHQKPHLKFTSDHINFQGTQIIKWRIQVLVYKILTNQFVRWLKSKLKRR